MSGRRNKNVGLHWRIVWLVTFRGWKHKWVIKALFVSRSTITRILRRYRETGTVEPIRGRPGPKPAWDNEEDLDTLDRIVKAYPYLIYNEMIEELQARTGLKVSKQQLCRMLHKLGITRKRMEFYAREARMWQKEAFAKEVWDKYSADQIVAVDETRKDDRTSARGRCVWSTQHLLWCVHAHVPRI